MIYIPLLNFVSKQKDQLLATSTPILAPHSDDSYCQSAASLLGSKSHPEVFPVTPTVS